MQDSMSRPGESPRVMLQLPPPSLAPLLPWAAFSMVCAVPGSERTLFFFPFFQRGNSEPASTLSRWKELQKLWEKFVIRRFHPKTSQLGDLETCTHFRVRRLSISSWERCASRNFGTDGAERTQGKNL